MKKLTQNRKALIAAVIILLGFTVVWQYVFENRGKASQEALATLFLTNMYEVEDHTGYNTMVEKMSASRTEDAAAPSAEDAFAEYEKRFGRITTASGYEQIVANRDITYADSFAAENGYLFEVSNVNLKVDYTDEASVQYIYEVKINAVSEQGKPGKTITAEGIVVLQPDTEGSFRVNAFKPFDRSMLAKALG